MVTGGYDDHLNNSVFRHLGVVVDPELSCEIRHVGAGWLAGCRRRQMSEIVRFYSGDLS